MITIHCGLHKTGSSSIQLALQLAGVRDRPVVLPQAGQSQSDDAWADRLRRLPPGALMSDENLLGSPFDGYEHAPARVRMLDECLRGRDFRILLYVRPQLPWLQSVYLQGVQQGVDLSPEDFISRAMVSPCIRWRSLLDLLQGGDAKSVAVRAYLPGRDVVADFFEQVGLGSPPRVGSSGLRENPSIAAVQAPILRALLSPDDPVGNSRLRSVFQGVLRAGAPQGLSPFPEHLQERCQHGLRSDWDELTSAVMSVDASEGSVFQGIGDTWNEGPAPFAGERVTDPLVADEMVRTLRLLAAGSAVEPAGVGQRIRRALADPAAATAALRRRMGRSR